MNKIKTKSISRLNLVLISLIVLACTVIMISCSQNVNKIKTSYNDNTEIVGLKHFDGYQLAQSTIVSRHNLRSAIDESGAPYINDTSVEFQKWTSAPGELTLKGGQVELMLGQYFRKYFESEKLIPQNWAPGVDESYFYSNSNQRTIATANYFSRGLLPVDNVDVDHKYQTEKNDPVFSRTITKSSQAYQEQYYKEVKENNDGKDFNEILLSLDGNIKKMEDFVGFRDSKYAKENNLEHFLLDNTEMDLSPGTGPKMKGTFKTCNEIVDALKMHYYEVEDDSLALFGKNISYSDLMQIFDIDNTYQKSVFSNHTYGVDRSNLLLKELLADISNPTRKVTFLCGHDNTLMAMLAALNAKDYVLPNTIDSGVPIGSKVVFNKFLKDGQYYCDINLVYSTVDQIRHCLSLDLSNPAMAVALQFDGIERNSDGLYKMSDIERIIKNSIDEYDKWQ